MEFKHFVMTFIEGFCHEGFYARQFLGCFFFMGLPKTERCFYWGGGFFVKGLFEKIN